ncbi:hypothetical protein HUJ04_011177 [Dendroctonus ponderosae]|nr:hypothetical protein HUJ04_011177 [Dendroctonus ponderosae]
MFNRNIRTRLDLVRRNITSDISEKQLSNNRRCKQRTQRRLVDQLLHFAGKIPTVQRPIDEEKDLQEEELLVAEVKNVEEIPQQLTPENPTTEVPEPRRSRTYRKAPQCLNL